MRIEGSESMRHSFAIVDPDEELDGRHPIVNVESLALIPSSHHVPGRGRELNLWPKKLLKSSEFPSSPARFVGLLAKRRVSTRANFAKKRRIGFAHNMS